MKYLLVTCALIACQGKSQAPAGNPAPSAGSAASAASTAAGSPTTTAASICVDALAAIDHSKCDSNEQGIVTARTSLEGIINTMTKVGGGDPHSYDIVCARMLLALERDLAGGGSASGSAGAAKGSGSAAKGPGGCTLAIDADLRGRVQRTLDEYFNQRTPVTKTGDAATDEVLAKFGQMRDAACECRTSACIDKLDAQAANLPLMPLNASQAAKDQASKIFDDASRCAQRARM